MKAAIVSTVKEPFLETFIDYHLSIGFDYFFLFFDDEAGVSTPKYVNDPKIIVIRRGEALEKKWKKMKTYPGKEITDSNIIARQCLNVELALEMSLDLGIDWLLHIDPDELFYSPDRSIREHFKKLSAEGVGIAIYHNHEAIPESQEIKDFFKEVTLFKKNSATLSPAQNEMIGKHTRPERPYFYYYGNGKSATRVSRSIIANGPHGFDFKKNILQTFFPSLKRRKIRQFESPCILHYTCCGFYFFWKKYESFGNFPDKWLDQYEIKLILPVHVAARDICRTGDQQSARQFYKEYFLDTPFRDRAVFVENGICFDVQIPGLKP